MSAAVSVFNLLYHVRARTSIVILHNYAYEDFSIMKGGLFLHISEARRRANDKWRDKFDEMRFRVPKGQKEVISNYAAANGESVNAFINRLINEELSKLNTSECVKSRFYRLFTRFLTNLFRLFYLLTIKLRSFKIPRYSHMICLHKFQKFC